MKRIVLVVIILFVAISVKSQQISGTQITSPVVPNDLLDNYPTHIDTLGYGGYRVLPDTISRNSIKPSRMAKGMLVYTLSDSSLYRLVDVNANVWEKVIASAHDIDTIPNSLTVKGALDIVGNPPLYSPELLLNVKNSEEFHRFFVSKNGVLMAGRLHDNPINVDGLYIIGANNYLNGINSSSAGYTVYNDADSTQLFGNFLNAAYDNSVLIGTGKSEIEPLSLDRANSVQLGANSTTPNVILTEDTTRIYGLTLFNDTSLNDLISAGENDVGWTLEGNNITNNEYDVTNSNQGGDLYWGGYGASVYFGQEAYSLDKFEVNAGDLIVRNLYKGFQVTDDGIIQYMGDYTANMIDDKDVITKGYADANYGGGGSFPSGLKGEVIMADGSNGGMVNEKFVYDTTNNAFTVGYREGITGTNSVVIGGTSDFKNKATQDFSFALGHGVEANYSNSIVIGRSSISEGQDAIAIGRGLIAHDYVESVFGIYNISGNGSQLSWSDDDNLFTIGNGSGYSTRSNAFQVKKNGNTTISGTLQAKGTMHIAKAEVLYTDTTQTTIITLPENAVIWDIGIEVVVACDDTGGSPLQIGTSTTLDKYWVNDIHLTDFIYGNLTGFKPDRMLSQTDIVYDLDLINGDATQGQVYIYIHYSLH